MAAGLKQALATWDLEESKLVCITTDNAADVILAAELNGWMRLQGFGHRLHLAIERAMKDHRVERAVGVCKKVVSTFSFSWKKRERAEKGTDRPQTARPLLKDRVSNQTGIQAGHGFQSP
uniref:Uncharacterized protein n=1 Tax=Nothobranchius furzeri TaxID=105023 RepID=A0A1A8U803_NOTFU